MRRTPDSVNIVSNRLAVPIHTLRRWAPWSTNDSRLATLAQSVSAGNRTDVFAWFRKRGNLPTPTYVTELAKKGRQITELDHLVPVKVLVDRLLDGSLSVDRVPDVLVIAECTRGEHEDLTATESEDGLRAIRNCPVDEIVHVALHRYAGLVTDLLRVDGDKRVSWNDMAVAKRDAKRYMNPR